MYVIEEFKRPNGVNYLLPNSKMPLGANTHKGLTSGRVLPRKVPIKYLLTHLRFLSYMVWYPNNDMNGYCKWVGFR